MEKTRPITAKKEVLPFIKDFKKIYGFMPTYEEIGEGFGKSKEWGAIMVKELEKLGLVTHEKGKNRAITIIKK